MPKLVITSEHYRVFEGDASVSNLEKLLAKAAEVDVVFLGEYHDDPVAHHLESVILESLAENRPEATDGTGKRPLALSMEMFERDVQPVLDEYMQGLVSESFLLKDGRSWKNYKTDYRPLVEFAREHEIPVVAANAPRRYVNLVGREGPEALAKLSALATTNYLPPLPCPKASPAYAAKFNSLMDNFARDGAKKKGEEFDDSPEATAKRAAGRANSVAAQNLWDATMAYSITEHLLRVPNAQVVHINGGFHTEKRLGTPEHLVRYRPGTSFLVVTMVASDAFPEFSAEDMQGVGDFVIVTDNELPRSGENGESE